MSNSLLMHLMISELLNKNPKLKSNLLKEAGEFPVLTPQEQGIDMDDTDEFKSLPHEHKVLSSSELQSVKEPKKGGLVSTLKKIGLAAGGAAITLGMLAIANFHDANVKPSSAKDHNTSHAIEQIVKKSPKKDKTLADQIIYEFEKSVDVEDSLYDDIISHEGFSSKPYIDVHNVSIGHGTGLYFGSSSNPAKIKKSWRKDLYKLYKVPKKLQKTDSKDGISKKTAKFIFAKKFNQIKSRFEKLAPYVHAFPERIQKPLYDLAYNMGPAFIRVFKGFNDNMILAAKSLKKGDLDAANTFLDSAASELVSNFNDDGSYKGKTKYAKDLPRRSEEVRSSIAQEIVLDIDGTYVVITPPDVDYQMPRKPSNENKKYSLKNIFFS